MMEETTFPIETVIYEIVTDPTEAPETPPAETVLVAEASEPTSPAFTEAPKTIETTEAIETVETVDYTPVIVESTGILANIYLCGAFMIVGVLVAFKFWEAK